MCGAFGVWLATHWIPPALYGQYGIFLSFTPLGVWVIHAGLIRYVSRHWVETPQKDELCGQIVRLAARRLPWLLIATAVAAYAFDSWPWAIATLLLFTCATLLSAAGVAQAGLQAGRQHWKDLRVNVTWSVMRTFMPLVLYAATNLALALPAGLVLAAFGYAAVAWLTVGLSPVNRADRPALPASYAGALFPILAVSGWALTGVTRWLAVAFFAPETAGHFTLANNVATILPGVLVAIAVQFSQPGWFAHPHELLAQRRQLLRRVDATVAVFLGIAVAACGLLHLVAPYLVGWLIADAFGPSVRFIFAAGCFAITTSIGALYQSALLAGKRERRIAGIELTFAAGLAASGAGASWAGEGWFEFWLIGSPVWALICYRTLARSALLKPA